MNKVLLGMLIAAGMVVCAVNLDALQRDGKQIKVLSGGQGRKFIEQGRQKIKEFAEENGIEFTGEFRKEIQEKFQQLRKAGEQIPAGMKNRYASAFRRLSLAELVARIKPRIKARIEALKGLSPEQKKERIMNARTRIMERLETWLCKIGAGSTK